MPSPQPDDSLSRTLATWRVSPPRDPQFRARVWERISRAAPLPWHVYARQHAAAVGGALALAVAIGAISGHERAEAETAKASERLAAAYVQTYDARTMQMLR